MSLPLILPPICGLQQNADDTNIRGTLVTSGSSGVKGSYFQLVSAMPFEAQGFFLTHSMATNECVLDLAIGASGSEAIIVANLAGMQRAAGADRFYGTYFPLRLRDGVRVAARTQCANSSVACYVGITAFKMGGPGIIPPGQIIETLGTVTSSRGVAVTPGATANTFGSWAAIGTTVRDWMALMIRLGVNGDNNTASANFRYQLGLGATGAETVIYEWLEGQGSGPKVAVGFGTREFLPIAVPAGKQLSVRAMASATISTATQRTTDAMIYGLAA